MMLGDILDTLEQLSFKLAGVTQTTKEYYLLVYFYVQGKARASKIKILIAYI